MGYFLTTSPETAVPESSLASPKTHTPFSRVKERGRRFYSPELARWLNRDPVEEEGGICLYCFSQNAPLGSIDPLGDTVVGYSPSLGNIIRALNALRRCAEGMFKANTEARDWFREAKYEYVCCHEGKVHLLEDYPGVVTGVEGGTHGVLHCALGVAARGQGVDEGCLAAANLLWEAFEVGKLKEWLPKWWPRWPGYRGKGPSDWLKDTIQDIKDVFDGYRSRDSMEQCIPGECHKKRGSI
jgi:RHS repeat-associated protein